jgi:hypothetical protein
MDFKRPITTLCIFSILLLFTQCEKEEIVVNKAETFANDAIQDANAKKPDKPPGSDKSSVEEVIITGDVWGDGLASTSVTEFEELFTLTLGERFNEDAGEFTGEIRILYGTKRKSENRIDFYYIDENEVPRYLLIRAETNSGAYDEANRTLNLDNCYAVIFERYTNGEIKTEYIPTSATVVLLDE